SLFTFVISFFPPLSSLELKRSSVALFRSRLDDRHQLFDFLGLAAKRCGKPQVSLEVETGCDFVLYAVVLMRRSTVTVISTEQVNQAAPYRSGCSQVAYAELRSSPSLQVRKVYQCRLTSTLLAYALTGRTSAN